MSNYKLLAASFAYSGYKVRVMAPFGVKPSTRKGKGSTLVLINLLGYMTK